MSIENEKNTTLHCLALGRNTLETYGFLQSIRSIVFKSE